MKTLCLKNVIILRNGEALIILQQACNLILTLSNDHSYSGSPFAILGQVIIRSHFASTVFFPSHPF